MIHIRLHPQPVLQSKGLLHGAKIRNKEGGEKEGAQRGGKTDDNIN